MTGKVGITAENDMGNDLARRNWITMGMIQKSSTSFFDGMVGSSPSSIVYQAKNDTPGSSNGHLVVFDYSGNLNGKAIKGRNQARGKGESKRKFSSRLLMERYRFVVYNGDKFDAANINDLSLTMHTKSRNMLSDLYTRFKDQQIFDAVQGNRGVAPSHIFEIKLGEFGYNGLIEMERNIKMSRNFKANQVNRRPLEYYREVANNAGCWLFVVDSDLATTIKLDPNYQSIMTGADVRGPDNRLIKGIIGKIGSMFIVEAPVFFGETSSTGSGNSVHIELDESGIELSGLRQRDGNGLWTGQEGFSTEGNLFSRGVILGANAVQLGFGMQPDYHFEPSLDFKIDSESALEVWMESQKTRLVPANSKDYPGARVAGIDHGVICVDVQVGGTA